MQYRLVKLSFTVSIIGICLFAIINLQNKQLKTEKSINEQKFIKQEKIARTSLTILKKMPDFGFNNLISDWTYLQFLQYIGDEQARKKTGYSLSSDYFETVVNHDPRFVRAYFLLSPATSIYAGQPQKTVNIIEKGLRSVSANTSSEAYYLWVYKAVDELLFLGNKEAAKESYKMASAWAEQSDHFNAKSSAANTKQTAQFLEDNPNSLVAQIGAWTMVLNSTNDTKTQNKALEKIQELGGEVTVSPDGSVKIKVPEDAT